MNSHEKLSAIRPSLISAIYLSLDAGELPLARLLSTSLYELEKIIESKNDKNRKFRRGS